MKQGVGDKEQVRLSAEVMLHCCKEQLDVGLDAEWVVVDNVNSTFVFWEVHEELTDTIVRPMRRCWWWEK